MLFRLAPCLAAAALLLACGTVPGGNTCPAPTGSGTTHATWPTTDETWTAAGSPHLITADLRVSKGLTLTVEPCAEVRLAKGTHLNVEGRLVANGTATQPISIGAPDLANAFGAIVVWGPGTASFAYATISNGGADTTNSYGALEARGDQLLAAQEILRVDHVAVKGAVQFGVSLRAGAAFTRDSTALSVSGAAVAPVRILPRLLSNLPTGTYTGNTLDAVVVETEAYGDPTLEDVTIRERGVPYVVGWDKTFGTIVVGTGTVPVKLTIEPGVVLKFKKNAAAGLHLDKGSNARAANATLVAAGTAAKPIVFTSAAAVPTAGDWLGLNFGNVPVAGNQLDHVEIRYAGGASGANGFHCQPNGAFSANEDAALTVWGVAPSAFLTNSTIADSAGLGVNLAYSGSFVDFVPTNTFANLASCKTGYPRNTGGSCPASVPCP